MFQDQVGLSTVPQFHSSTFKQKLLWIDQSMSYISKNNSSEGKTLSEYLNQHNDKIAFEGHMHPID